MAHTDECDNSEIVIHPKRLRAIDHTTRNTAQTLNGLAEHILSLPDVTADLRKVSEALSGERRAMASDRAKLDELGRNDGKMETRMTTLESKVDSLNGTARWGAGALTVASAMIGWAIYLLLHFDKR